MSRAAFVWLLLPLIARADLVCPAPDHDAGAARTGTRLTHTFALQNTGTAPVEILGVKAGCGCTSAVPAKTRIAPGETTTLRMEVGTVTQAAGPNAWRADVRHAGGVLSLVMRATLEADVRISPANLVLAAGVAGHPFTLTELRAAPMTLRAVSCVSPHLRAEAEQPRREGEAWVRRINVRVLPTLPEGRHEDALVIHTEDTGYPELRVPFSVVKRTADAVQVSPESAEASRDAGGAVPARLVMLRVSGETPVRVKAVKASHPSIRCTWADGEGRAVLRIAFEAVPGPFTGEVEVELSEPAKVVKIPVTVR